MNLQAIAELIAKMPAGPQRDKLEAKQNELFAKINEKKSQVAAQQNQDRKGANGLNDTFKFDPTGHITIEAINADGEVIGTLVDKENLVVKGADEIALRALSGDPTRILYKNRKILTSGKAKGELDKALLKGRDLIKDGRILHAANIVWNGVNEEDFQVEYSFIPTYLYIKEVASTDPSKVAFEITETTSTGAAPLQSEIYSTQTNLFIGLGNGKDRLVPFNESIVSYSNPADFDLTSGQAVTAKQTAFIKMNAKISRFRAVVERSPLGSKVGVYVNGALKETLVSYKSDGIDTIEYEFTGLDLEQVSEIKFQHEGGTESGTPAMTIKAIYADALTVNMNSLMSEFKSFETDFSTPTSYNTKPDAPYTVQLPYTPIVKGSVKVSYQGKEFSEVNDVASLTADAFHVNVDTGLVTFHRALTGVYIGFKLEEAIRYEERIEAGNTKLTSTSHTEQVEETKTASNKAIGTGNGTNKVFSLGEKTVKTETVVIKVKNVQVSNYTLAPNAVTGVIEATFDTAPLNAEAVTATFDYTQMVPKVTPLIKYAPKEAIDTVLTLVDHNGAALTKVETDPLNKGEYQLVDGDIVLNTKAVDGTTMTKFIIKFESTDFKGKPTNYKRAVIDKPKSENLYPWFELDKGKIQFIAEFPEEAMLQNMTIREMILANGPRADDGIEGFDNYDVKAFSIVRVPETIKNVNSGIRITWTITLLNENSLPFLGGNN